MVVGVASLERDWTSEFPGGALRVLLGTPQAAPAFLRQRAEPDLRADLRLVTDDYSTPHASQKGMNTIYTALTCT
jgi:hypothetical protein